MCDVAGFEGIVDYCHVLEDVFHRCLKVTIVVLEAGDKFWARSGPRWTSFDSFHRDGLARTSFFVR